MAQPGSPLQTGLLHSVRLPAVGTRRPLAPLPGCPRAVVTPGRRSADGQGRRAGVSWTAAAGGWDRTGRDGAGGGGCLRSSPPAREGGREGYEPGPLGRVGGGSVVAADTAPQAVCVPPGPGPITASRLPLMGRRRTPAFPQRRAPSLPRAASRALLSSPATGTPRNSVNSLL